MSPGDEPDHVGGKIAQSMQQSGSLGVFHTAAKAGYVVISADVQTLGSAVMGYGEA